MELLYGISPMWRMQPRCYITHQIDNSYQLVIIAFFEFLEEEFDEVKFGSRIFFDICCSKCQNIVDARVNAYIRYHREACRKTCHAPRIDAFHWQHSLIPTRKWVITADVTILPSSTLLISFHPPSRLIKRRIASSCGHSKIIYRSNTSASVEFRSVYERVLPHLKL